MENMFHTLEEMKSKYSFDREDNVIYDVCETSTFCPTPEDLRIAKIDNDGGWYDEKTQIYHGFIIDKTTWFTHYCYSFVGDYWFLGDDTWDGIVEATKPPINAEPLVKGWRRSFESLEDAKKYVEDKLYEQIQ